MSLFLRNLFFTILQPGIVAGVVPYLIITNEVYVIYPPAEPHTYLGIFLFLTGLVVTLNCIARFATEGRGTLSPADPTKHLVVKGLYKYSRNPMYVGVMLLLIGEALTYEVTGMWVYAAVLFIVFNLFIVNFEEPRLAKDFGDEYLEYKRTVRRWGGNVKR